MTSSLTVSFSGKNTELQANFLPEIILDENYDYSCALLDLIITNSTNVNKIVTSGVLNINCDLISGSYINGVQSRAIHQFHASASRVKDQTLVEIPNHLNYFPVKIKDFQSIQISIVDSNRKPINIYGGDIICRINIKRVQH